MSRACIYNRVTAETRGQRASDQLFELRHFATSQGWKICHEYIDQEANRASRPQFRRLLVAAERNQFDIVLFWSLERFSPEGALATLQHLNTLTSYGIGFRAFNEPDLNTCGVCKDVIVSILGMIAEQEAVRTSENVRDGLRRAREQGVKLGRPRRVVDYQEVVRLREVEKLSWSRIAERMGLGQGTVVRAYRNRKSS